MQVELFEAALQELTSNRDLVNQVLEVTMGENDITIRRYALPASDA